MPQVNLGELVKNCRHSILLYVFDAFGKFGCTLHVDWGILLHTISYNFGDT